MRRVIKQMGIEPERIKLVWASAAEGVKLAQEITDMVEEVRALGPLNWTEHQNGFGPTEEQTAEPVAAGGG